VIGLGWVLGLDVLGLSKSLADLTEYSPAYSTPFRTGSLIDNKR